MTAELYHNFNICATCQAMVAENGRLRVEITRLEWDETIGMLNAAGGFRAINALPDGRYALVFCDIDYLKQINSATGNHMQTNRYLMSGLRVRRGEIAIRLMGDEFLFILTDGRGYADPVGFVERLTHQLAEQPLTAAERAGLPGGALSATFAWRASVKRADIRAAIERLSAAVLAQKAARPC